MARREVRVLWMTKIGLVAAILACLAALVALVMMVQVWREGVIFLIGPRRRPVVQLAIVAALVFGFPSFRLSLEGATELAGKWRRFGWLGFVLGVIGSLAGVAAGLCYYFYKV